MSELITKVAMAMRLKRHLKAQNKSFLRLRSGKVQVWDNPDRTGNATLYDSFTVLGNNLGLLKTGEYVEGDNPPQPPALDFPNLPDDMLISILITLVEKALTFLRANDLNAATRLLVEAVRHIINNKNPQNK